MVNGKQKGSKFEREVCVALSKAMTLGRRNDLYWRSAMSGGRATVMNRRGGSLNKAQPGDISAIDPLGHWLTDMFVVECKHHKDLKLTHFLLNDAGPIANFLNVAEAQSAPLHKQALLIAKENNLPTLVFTKATLLGRAPDGTQVYFQPLLATSPGRVLVFKFEHFLDRIRKLYPPAVRRRLST